MSYQNAIILSDIQPSNRQWSMNILLSEDPWWQSILRLKAQLRLQRLKDLYMATEVDWPELPDDGATRKEWEKYNGEVSQAIKAASVECSNVMFSGIMYEKDGKLRQTDVIDLTDHILTHVPKGVPPNEVRAAVTKKLKGVGGCWLSGLIWTSQGYGKNVKTVLAAHPANIKHLLCNDPKLRGKVRHNVLLRQPEWSGELEPLPGARRPKGVVQDHHYSYVAQLIYKDWELNAEIKKIHHGVLHASMDNCMNPVREWLLSLKLDGSENVEDPLDEILDDLLDALGVEQDRDIAKKMLRMWLIGAVARGMNTGMEVVKMDYTLVLEGAQGKKKSTLIEALAGKDWCGELQGDITKKDTLISMQGIWIAEITELSAFKATKHMEALKAFLTRKIDKYRPVFGMNSVNYPRICVFIGTTNDAQYLNDDTGGRRFWPIRCSEREFDIGWVIKFREKIWAAVVAAYQNGEKWWPQTEEDEVALQAQQEERRLPDPWEDSIAAVLGGIKVTKAEYVYQSLVQRSSLDDLENSTAKTSRKEMRRVVNVLQLFGWKSVHLQWSEKGNKHQHRAWTAPGVSVAPN